MERNFRMSNPIEYVLKCMLEGVEVEKFDIRNAIDQWNNTKKILSEKEKEKNDS